MTSMMKRAAIAAALTLASLTGGQALAAEAKHPHAMAWSWEGPFGTFDRAALQRGFQVYKEVCSSCHGLKHLSYRNLGEPGGPFQAVAPKGWQDEGYTPKIGAPGHGKYIVNANDNPYVRAIAAQYEVTEISTEDGSEITRPARPSDTFLYPYASEGAGRAANGGAYPPDLSVMIKARHYGPDYVYALMTGYGEEIPKGVDELPGKHWNPYFPGGWIAMPEQLVEDRVSYADGTKATKEQMAKDVVTFLTWASDPKAEIRKSLGVQAVAYLLLLSILLYLVYRQVWRNVEH